MARIAALGYHEVTDNPEDSGFQRPRAILYKHSRARFREHLDAIAATGRVPTVVYAIDFDAPGEHLLLTFDDGGRSAVDIGEELSQRGWRGHFLITTSLIGQPGFLDVASIRALHAAGHVIGSHAHHHADAFRAQSLEAMRWEWQTSCDRLSDLLGVPCAVASVPGGQISDLVMESARASRLRYLFTSDPVMQASRRGQCRIIGRACIKSYTSCLRVSGFARGRGWRRARFEQECKAMARVWFPGVYARCLRLCAWHAGLATASAPNTSGKSVRLR
jgi:hypothetical protein